MMSSSRLLFLLVLSSGTWTPVEAQSRSRSYIEVTIGGSALVGHAPFNGEHYRRRSIHALVALGHQADVTRTLVAALHVGLLTAPTGSDGWCRPTPLGGCLQEYPLGGLVALTIGGRPLQSLWRHLELTAGPAVVVPYHTGTGTTIGLFAVGRLGTPPGFYLSPGLSFHGIVTPMDRTVMFAAGLGVSLRTW
jgi:hypothetical protein